jgi:hypothetical protein
MEPLTTSQLGVVGLALFFLAIAAVFRFVHWIRTATPTVDPWAEAFSAAADEPGATPLCTRCLAAHEETDWFCPHCGHVVGPWMTWMPYLQNYALGELLRDGTRGRFIVRPLVVWGYIVLGAAQYLLLAPVYWWQLWQNVRRLRAEAAAPPAPESAVIQ